MTSERELLNVFRSNFQLFAVKVFNIVNPGEELEPTAAFTAIGYKLSEVVQGTTRRLTINVPPRSGCCGASPGAAFPVPPAPVRRPSDRAKERLAVSYGPACVGRRFSWERIIDDAVPALQSVRLTISLGFRRERARRSKIDPPEQYEPDVTGAPLQLVRCSRFHTPAVFREGLSTGISLRRMQVAERGLTPSQVCPLRQDPGQLRVAGVFGH
jgi:hypothetical protein